MYQIICITDGEEHVLMDMRDEEYILQSPVLTLELNSPGSLKFTIQPNHPEFNAIKTLTTIVKVYKINGSDKKWMFSGRVMTMEHDIRNTGKVECEGILAFLCDSIVRPYEFEGTPADYVTSLITSHNSQVDERKRFKIGVLDLADADSNNNIVRANSNYPSSLSEMNEKVVKLLETYIYAREEEDSIYFDCYQAITHVNTQPILFGDNIIDLNQTVTAEEIKTVMIGIGAEDDEGDKPTVIAENAEAIAVYGRIVGTVEFENVTTTTQLELKTAAYLDSVLGLKKTIEVKAVDLNMKDSDIEEISLGYAYVTSRHNGIEKQLMLISKMQLYLTEPENNTFTLGSERTTISSAFSNTSAKLNNMINKVEKNASSQIEKKVSNATQLITGARGGFVVLDCGENAEQVPEQILIMDTPDKETAVNVIRINKNGIGFSTSGYSGPYRNAWTIDGNLVADFITAGTMYADRIKGGTLTLGGVDNQSGVANIIDGKGNTLVKLDKNGLTLDSSVKIAWGNISGTDDVAYKDDIPTDDHITQITKNTVTTAYVNALNITAGNVAAENITGNTISGKTIRGGTVTGATITGNTISGGTISGAVINGGTINGGTVSGGTISGASISGSNITGSSFYQTANNTYLSIANGEIRGGANGSETGYISYASNVGGTPSLDFRASILNFCMDTIYLGRGKGATEMTKAYTGDIKYVWQVGATSYETAVMSFTNGILLDNGRTS